MLKPEDIRRVHPVEDKMNINDVVCKEYRYENVIPFHLHLISKGNIDFFVPISFQCGDSQFVKVCYNLSNLNPIGKSIEVSEAPYIASSLMKGMKEAMDRYIFPNQFLVREKVVYTGRNKSIRVAYVPKKVEELPPKDPGKVMRKKAYSLLMEIYDVSDKSPIDGNSILNSTLEVLRDNTIGLDTCIRKLEKLKEEPYYLQDLSGKGRVDLYNKFI